MFALMKSHTSLEIGHVGSRTRSPGQILEKHYVHSTGYIFSPITMKLGQNDFLNEISDEFGNGSCRVKSWSLGQMLGKHEYVLDP